MQQISNTRSAFDATAVGTLLDIIARANPALTSGVVGAASKKVKPGDGGTAPRDVLAGLLGLASTLSGNQAIVPSANAAESKPQLDPVTDAVQKQVIKNTKAQVDEAMQQGVPAEHIMAHQSGKAPVLNRIMSGLWNNGSVNQETGDVTQPSALFGLLQSTPADQLNRQNAANARPSMQLQQKIKEAEQVPVTQAQQLVAMTSLLKSQGKLTDEQKAQKSAMGFGQQVVDIIDQYDQLKAQGKAGPIGANFFKGVTVGNDEDINEFDSMAGALVYTAAKALADQQGRGVSDSDIKRMDRIFKVSATSREKTLAGKLNAGVKIANSKYGLNLPTVEKIRQLRQKQQKEAQSSGPMKIGRFQVEVS